MPTRPLACDPYWDDWNHRPTTHSLIRSGVSAREYAFMVYRWGIGPMHTYSACADYFHMTRDAAMALEDDILARLRAWRESEADTRGDGTAEIS